MKKEKKNLLTGNVKMDTETIFMTNGNINIYPCIWEQDKDVAEQRVAYNGRITVEEDGTTHVKRYHVGIAGPKYQQLYTTPHGEVKVTRRRDRKDYSKLVVKFSFPLDYPRTLMEECLGQEVDEIMAYFHTRKEDTQW